MVSSCSRLMTSTLKVVGHPRLQRGLLGGSQSSRLGSSVDDITDSVLPGDRMDRNDRNWKLSSYHLYTLAIMLILL